MLDLISPDDLHIETWPRRPTGGQVVGGAPRGVRVEHIPTGLVAISVSARSQHINKMIAMDMILAGLTHSKA